ncbi:o-succinylbenzoate synthase [Aneurinibacillus aneurinilyticus]|jgi:O-succinylbenzoate synthase|uniref:o-succinylbenzoate synthase n=2 Tax=Aneurinibacillus aneurinilyticus TaxID=1391 RepID=A0A848CSA4_ANEAE|nr:o-succinylbenzoate synthase [Aneurinibacillus aneurinilyticus]ERI10350.1 o-succinylbenzoate synthase [Aneurinibacillus aneurinilyticus ATCC 12856]MCI1696419.1 o-succinylbenzoate synthase [Aneurinibacillus aneurinilyticus]MED0707643.1 o-succinylbenzoate synthase [Aneurinibacillus aneurinilyticus]MED0725980.1 o-succinylbenzoate synthase [Aneurinibacillus aneurinilyticus]MED0735006.1 o-succinylbenzoate synthase [Aneurinibacillus aneurinilyticus]
MIIKEVTLRHVKMKMKAPFTTSFGTFQDKEFLLLEAKDDNGMSGWGESVAFHSPWYNEETLKTNWHMLEDFIIPSLLNKEVEQPEEVSEILSYIRKNNMAKSTIEGAVWDLFAKRKGITLAAALGGEKTEIEVGISIGIQNTIDDLLQLVDEYVNDGYKRMKIKIKPGWDVEVMREVRKHFPHIPLMADANSAYRLKDIDRLKALDEFDLMMIEQPLASDDIVDHAQLQKKISTPICLDESIHSYEDARKAIELGSCKIINIKIGRVGGLTESKRIHDLCQQHGIPVWCGGMLESGVGRAHNIALTTLANFVMPGDTAGSSRYWEQDIIEPEVVVKNGMITIPDKPGIGYEPNREIIQQFTAYEKSYS